MGVVKEFITSYVKGEFLLRLGVHKLLPYILYVFLLAVLTIWLSYKAEVTMYKVEQNKRTIENLKIDNVNKTCEIVSLTRISSIERMLEEIGSDVKSPKKPVYTIK